MLISSGLTPVSAALGALGVVAPALVWFVQPLLSARTHRRRNFESEDYFWNFGPGGYVQNGGDPSQVGWRFAAVCCCVAGLGGALEEETYRMVKDRMVKGKKTLS